jgi:hypothetical protein
MTPEVGKWFSFEEMFLPNRSVSGKITDMCDVTAITKALGYGDKRTIKCLIVYADGGEGTIDADSALWDYAVDLDEMTALLLIS